MEEKEKVSKNFIEMAIDKDLEEGVYDHVMTRFPLTAFYHIILIFPVQVKINGLLLYRSKYCLQSAHISYNLSAFYTRKHENT